MIVYSIIAKNTILGETLPTSEHFSPHNKSCSQMLTQIEEENVFASLLREVLKSMLILDLTDILCGQIFEMHAQLFIGFQADSYRLAKYTNIY